MAEASPRKRHLDSPDRQPQTCKKRRAIFYKHLDGANASQVDRKNRYYLVEQVNLNLFNNM